MSNTHKSQTKAQSESKATASNASHAAQSALASGSTPAKKKLGADVPYASVVKTFQQARHHLGKEMNGYWLGAMPVDAFLDKFAPATKEPLPDLPDDPFKGVPSDGVESKRYDKFITVIQGWIPHLHAVNTGTKGDTVNNVKLKTDISIYNRAEGVAVPDKTNFSKIELWMEFKVNHNVAFNDPRDNTEESRLSAINEGSFTPDTDEGNKARGQLAHYAGAQHSLQFRHFSFSIVVEGNHARFLRWDPSGTVVTAAFNYRTDPSLMAEFLWRFDHLTPEQRGYDESIQQANLPAEVDARVRERLGIEDKGSPLYRYEVPGLVGIGYAYGPRPPTQNRSLVSRCTRNLPVLWVPVENVNDDPRSPREPGESDTDRYTGQDEVKKGPWSEERIIYMKDTWRFLSDSPNVEVKPEHEIYQMLHEHGTPNIPEHVAGGDVKGGRTEIQELIAAPWLRVKPRISPYQHYRLVHGIVGRALFKFESTKQLVTAVFDALRAHSHAFNRAKILHRDISAGNIILTDEGKGLLIDWELAKPLNEDGSRRPDRTGTWQFMSANLLQHRGKVHTLADDLESFLHVLSWMMLRYVPAGDAYDAEERGFDMLKFDEHSVRKKHFDYGGVRKCDALRGGSYPSVAFKPQTTTPLCELLTDLSSPFKSLYAVRPPTAEDRRKISVPKSEYDENLEGLSWTIRQHDRDIQRLDSPTWFINEIKKFLDEKPWPADDEADINLPVAFPEDTTYQTKIKTSQLQFTQDTFERSKGLSINSKRAASPTPEPTAKRRRGTPAPSESAASESGH